MEDYLWFTIGAIVPIISLLVFVNVWSNKRDANRFNIIIALCDVGKALTFFWFMVVMILVWM